MKIDGDRIEPEEGMVLIRKSDNLVYGGGVTLKYTYFIGAKRLAERKREVPEDYTEIPRSELDNRLEVLGMYWPVPGNEYGVLKDFIIKLKYSLEDQMAVMCNYSEDPNNETYKQRYEEMQSWRSLASDISKKWIEEHVEGKEEE